MMKKSRFTNVLRGESYLLHNALHNTMIKAKGPIAKAFVDKMSDESVFDIDFDDPFQSALVTQKMIVEDECDEDQLFHLVEGNRHSDQLRIVMMVTHNCNFGCPYCLQGQLKDAKAMAWEVYQECADMVVHLVEKHSYQNVLFSWFGGEPSLEHDNICRFLHLLRKKLSGNVDIIGHFTSNGYLLNRKRFDELVSLGICSYQITIDGPEHLHDRSRFLLGGQGTFRIIMDNLISWKCSTEPFTVMIRTNFDQDFIDETDSWFDYISDTFGDDPRFFSNFSAILPNGNEELIRNYDVNAGIEAIGAIMAKARERGLYQDYNISSIGFGGLACHAGFPHAFVVEYDGKLKKCEGHLEYEDNIVGDLLGSTPGFNKAQLEKWINYDIGDICRACSILPVCMGKVCPAVMYRKETCDIAKGLYEQVLRKLYLDTIPISTTTG